jgi:hypothetical protein
MEKLRTYLLISFLLLLGGGLCSALEPGQDIISHEFWIELYPAVKPEDGEYPIPKKVAIEELLEEVRYVLSGMIYGFGFSYTPYDKTRQIEEQFTLEPVASIPWGDPNLSVVSTRVEEKILYVRVRYRLAEYQKPWADLWRSSSIPVTGGTGEGKYFLGTQGKRTSMENAVKESIRLYFRARVHNKPRQIRGEVLFTHPPRTFIRSGAFKTQVRLKLRTEEVVPYQFY